MKKWVTEIIAIDPNDGQLKRWHGEIVEAPTLRLAQVWCELNEKGYLQVTGELLSEIPTKKNNLTPDFKKRIDYDKIYLN